MLWPDVRPCHMFCRKKDLVDFHVAGPWRVMIGNGSRCAIVSAWRKKSDILAIRHIVADECDLPEILGELAKEAKARGFYSLMSPMIRSGAAAPFVAAGMRCHEKIVNIHIDLRKATRLEFELPKGMKIRTADRKDVDAVFDLDGRCFDSFWAMDRDELSAAVGFMRMTVAEEGGKVIGYTLSHVERSTGTLGRLAVASESRRLGLGSSLLLEAGRHLVRSGVFRMSLCTQAQNLASRRLYSRFEGIEEEEALVLMIGST